MTAPFRCMLIVDVDDVARRRDAIGAALAGGIDAVQLRDRHAGGADLLTAARRLRADTRPHRTLLLVNDRADVALAAEADGVHLPASGWPIARVRALAFRPLLVGRSTHAPAEARTAADDGADYVVLGPVFATPSKVPYGAPLGLAALAETDIAPPLVAIGGITVENAAGVIRAGATGVAVIRAVLDAADPSAAARALRTAAERA